MKRLTSPVVVCLLLFFVSTLSVSAQQRRRVTPEPTPLPTPSPTAAPQFTNLVTTFGGGNLQLTFGFAGDVSSFNNSTLKYVLTTEKGASFPEKTLPFTSSADKNKLIFNVPVSELAEVAKLTGAVALAGAGATNTTSPSVDVDVRYFNELQRASQEVERLRKANNELETKANATKRDLDSVLEGNQPSDVNFERVNLITDEKIVMSFTANRPGRIRAIITGPDGFTKQVESPNIATNHAITFDGLRHSTQYDVKVEALALKDRQPIPGVSKDPTKDAGLRVKTAGQVNPPVVSWSVTPASDRISVAVTSDQEVFTEIEYRELLDPGLGKFGVAQRVGFIKADEFGSFSGESSVAANATRPFTITDLKESSRYEVTLRAVNKTGKTPTNLLRTIVETPKNLPKFEFAKMLNVQMSPLGVKVDWNATTNITEGFLDIVYDGDTTFIGSKKAKVSGQTATAVLDLSEVDKMAKRPTPPTIRLRMTDGKSTVERELQVSFVIPDKATIRANTALPEQTKNQLLSIADNIEKNKGVNWQSVMQTGLSILVRTFLPAP